jgi:hypothetical protein
MEIPMPKTVLNCTLTSTQGKYAFDPVSKILTWEVGKIDGQKLPNIRGSVSILIISCPINIRSKERNLIMYPCCK